MVSAEGCEPGPVAARPGGGHCRTVPRSLRIFAAAAAASRARASTCRGRGSSRARFATTMGEVIAGGGCDSATPRIRSRLARGHSVCAQQRGEVAERVPPARCSRGCGRIGTGIVFVLRHSRLVLLLLVHKLCPLVEARRCLGHGHCRPPGVLYVVLDVGHESTDHRSGCVYKSRVCSIDCYR